MSSSEMALARHPRPLGGWISGEGGDVNQLRDRVHGTLETCKMAPSEEERPMWKRNLEGMG